jgi:hypothetical protein
VRDDGPGHGIGVEDRRGCENGRKKFTDFNIRYI